MASVLHCSAVRPELSYSKEPYKLKENLWKGSASFQVSPGEGAGMLALPLTFLRLIVWPLLCCLLRNIGMGGSWGISMSFPALEPLLRICPSRLQKGDLGVERQAPERAQDRPGALKADLSASVRHPVRRHALSHSPALHGHNLEALGLFHKP